MDHPGLVLRGQQPPVPMIHDISTSYRLLRRCARGGGFMTGAPSLLSPLPWDFLPDRGHVSVGDATSSPSRATAAAGPGRVSPTPHVSGRHASSSPSQQLRAELARANAAPPKFLGALCRLVRRAPGVRPKYAENPLRLAAALAPAPCEEAPTSRGQLGDDGDCVALVDVEAAARRWAETAARVCDWSNVPPQLDVAHPLGGAVPLDRGERKRQQVLNVVLFVAPLFNHKPDAVVVDFCCGGAHQSLPLARAFPRATFILIDAKERSLDVARQRAAAARLTNVRFVCGLVEDFDEPFDVGIALHACGAASDVAMEKCIAVGAAYVISPCCVGKIALAAAARARRAADRTGRADQEGREAAEGMSRSGSQTTHAGRRNETVDRRVVPDDPLELGKAPMVTMPSLGYPRSSAAAAAVSAEAYVSIAQAADFGHDGYDDGWMNGGGTRMAQGANESSEEEEGERLATVAEDGDEDGASRPGCQATTVGALALMAARREKRARMRNRGPKMSAAAREMRASQRRACKAVVEADRSTHATEHGYTTWQVLMEPATCTPKNDVLIGIPTQSCGGSYVPDGALAQGEDVQVDTSRTVCRGDADDRGSKSRAGWTAGAATEYNTVLSIRADIPAATVFDSLLDNPGPRSLTT